MENKEFKDIEVNEAQMSTNSTDSLPKNTNPENFSKVHLCNNNKRDHIVLAPIVVFSCAIEIICVTHFGCALM